MRLWKIINIRQEELPHFESQCFYSFTLLLLQNIERKSRTQTLTLLNNAWIALSACLINPQKSIRFTECKCRTNLCVIIGIHKAPNKPQRSVPESSVIGTHTWKSHFTEKGGGRLFGRYSKSDRKFILGITFLPC